MNENKPMQADTSADSAVTPWWQRESFHSLVIYAIFPALVMGMLIYLMVKVDQQYATLNSNLLALNNDLILRFDMLAARIDEQAARIDAQAARMDILSTQMVDVLERLSNLSGEFAFLRVSLGNLMDEQMAHVEKHVLLDARLDSLTETN